MQHSLRIMPEAIPEVPRDGNLDSYQGVGERRDGRFDSLYKEQLDAGNDNKPSADKDKSSADKDKAATIDTPQSGKEAPTKPQSSEEKRLDAGQTDGIKPAKPTADEGQGSTRDKMDGKLELLIVLMEKSDSLLKNPKTTAFSEHHGEQALADLSMRHNKLTAAIESALSGNAQDLKAILAELKSMTEGGEVSIDAETEKLIAAELKQLLLDEGGKKGLQLDGARQSEVATKLKELMSGQTQTQQPDGKAEINKHQTPGINPNAGNVGKANSDSQAQTAQSQANTIKNIHDALQTDPIVVESEQLNVGKVDKPFDLDAQMSPGINPKGETIDKSNGKGNAAQVDMTQINKGAHKPVEVIADSGKPVKIDLDVIQTPGISPENAEQQDDIVTRPVELAGDKGKTAPFATDGLKPTAAALANAEGKQEQQGQQTQTKPMEKADPVLSAMMAANNKQDGKNILGTADKGKTNNSAAIAKQVKLDPQGQAAIDESKLAELNQDGQIEQGMSEQHRQIIEDKFSRFVPKDLALGIGNKATSASTGSFASQLAAEGLSSLNAAQADKATKLPPQLTEAINIAKPQFSANMKERLTVMMSKNIQRADIRLDPAELGQMQVKMSVENDVTSVSFVVQNAQAKELLEQAMPKLKDMLAEQGIDLGEGSVQQEDKEQQQWQARQNNDANGRGQQSTDTEQEVEPMLAQQVKIAGGALGGIDFFA